MFRELGYLWEGTVENGRIYEAMESESAVKVRKEYADFYESEESHGMRIPAALILACAQLLKEMEDKNERI